MGVWGARSPRSNHVFRPFAVKRPHPRLTVDSPETNVYIRLVFHPCHHGRHPAREKAWPRAGGRVAIRGERFNIRSENDRPSPGALPSSGALFRGGVGGRSTLATAATAGRFGVTQPGLGAYGSPTRATSAERVCPLCTIPVPVPIHAVTTTTLSQSPRVVGHRAISRKGVVSSAAVRSRPIRPTRLPPSRLNNARRSGRS